MSDELAARYREATELLREVREVIDERPVGAAVPRWAARRGWGPFLAGLHDDAVEIAERVGLAGVIGGWADAPTSLRAVSAAVSAATALPRLAGPGGVWVDRRVSARKGAQVAAFGAVAAGVAAGRRRVVDVGSGHGHLTRHLASVFDVAAEGWERDPARVETARALSRDPRTRFVAAEVGALAATLRGDDLVVGLHACGGLGDLAVEAARAVGAAVALVGCCPQKREGARAPLGTEESPRADLTFDRAVLGLANVGDGEAGVEDDLATRTRSRVQRRALAALLRAAGRGGEPGEEMRGINRRRATGDFHDLAAHAFGARGMAPPGSAALREALTAAWRDHAVERRMVLPRAMLGRLLEVWIALDRAEHLRRSGRAVRVGVVFEVAVSPRNVLVLGA